MLSFEDKIHYIHGKDLHVKIKRIMLYFKKKIHYILRKELLIKIKKTMLYFWEKIHYIHKKDFSHKTKNIKPKRLNKNKRLKEINFQQASTKQLKKIKKIKNTCRYCWYQIFSKICSWSKILSIICRLFYV